MIANHKRPYFKKKVLIEGNCLFLMGPIGTFFARLSSYLEDNNVNLFEKLEIINEITKLILSEHDEKEILNYITKNDLAIIKEYGFYLSLKNVNWVEHFQNSEKAIHINLIKKIKEKPVYKKKNIPKSLKETVISKHFGNRFESNCFVHQLIVHL